MPISRAEKLLLQWETVNTEIQLDTGLRVSNSKPKWNIYFIPHSLCGSSLFIWHFLKKKFFAPPHYKYLYLLMRGWRKSNACSHQPSSVTEGRRGRDRAWRFSDVCNSCPWLIMLRRWCTNQFQRNRRNQKAAEQQGEYRGGQPSFLTGFFRRPWSQWTLLRTAVLVLGHPSTSYKHGISCDPWSWLWPMHRERRESRKHRVAWHWAEEMLPNLIWNEKDFQLLWLGCGLSALRIILISVCASRCLVERRLWWEKGRE